MKTSSNILNKLYEGENVGGMTIYDYIVNVCDGEIDMDVSDTEIDMMVALCYDVNDEYGDEYPEMRKFLTTLVKNTKIVKQIDGGYAPILICDFSSFFKPYNEQLKDFFDMDYSDFDADEAYYEAVANLEPLISGNASESQYRELNEILAGKQTTNEADNMESTIDEAARYLFDEGDKDYLPDYEEFNDSIMEISKDLFDKAKERALEALTNLAEHQYYDHDGGYGTVLELNDNHTIWELNNENKSDEEWASIVNSKLAQFEADTGVELMLLGRMGRHACVEPTYDNCMNFTYLQETQEKLEQEAIDEFNADEMNESADLTSINVELPTEDKNINEAESIFSNSIDYSYDEDNIYRINNLKPLHTYNVAKDLTINVYKTYRYHYPGKAFVAANTDKFGKWVPIYILPDKDGYFFDYEGHTVSCPDIFKEVDGQKHNSKDEYYLENAHELNESADLTAEVIYHNEDGTRDYITGKLSDGRYFLIGQQEQVLVSDKDLPSLAKKDMDDFRYDEDGDKDFIEALENGTTLDKNSDLAKIIINASKEYLDDGCYLLSESANIDVNNLTKEQLWKLRQEIVLGSLYTHDYDNSFGIDPSAVCNFFDSFIEDAQMDDYGKPNNRKTEEYDNAEDLYNYYCSCENPFGEVEDINESEDVAIDKDPDLDNEQVNADVDYWTEIDEANTEDVSDKEPLGVYTVSNNNSILIYEIEYDIHDRVLAGDSSNRDTAMWRDIIYDADETYFWYGDIKVPLDEVMRTNI